MAITYGVVVVRSADLTPSGTTAVFSVTSAPTAGSLLVMSGFAGNLGATTVAVSDSKGNTWTVDNGPNTSGFGFGFTASTLQAVGALTTSDTVTMTFGVTNTNGVGCDVREFIGASNTVDSTGSNSSNSTSGINNTGTLSPVAAGCAVVASSGFGFPTTAPFNATGTVGTYLDTQLTLFWTGNRDMASGYLLNPTAGVSQQLDLNYGATVSFTGLITAYKPVVVAHDSRMFMPFFP